MQLRAGSKVVVAGGGALGLAVGLELARRNAEVLIVEREPEGANASRIAAGMLAPTLECVLDRVSAPHFFLLQEARDAWPALAQNVGAPLFRCGALWFGPRPEAHERVLAILHNWGAQAELLQPAAAAALSPGLTPPGPALHAPGDWRLDAGAMLDAMQAAFARAGGRMLAGQVQQVCSGRLTLAGGEELAADAVVLATGMPPAGASLEGLSELALLRPIKGQLLRYPQAGPRSGPVVRTPVGYVAPGGEGACVGATMEPDLDDREVTHEAVHALRSVAEGLYPDLAGRPEQPAAGVRAATPDGLPMVGESSLPGVFLALGARRNGWLLAPLVAQALAQVMSGGEGRPEFDPHRFFAAS